MILTASGMLLLMLVVLVLFLYPVVSGEKYPWPCSKSNLLNRPNHANRTDNLPHIALNSP
jgi:hypothetical protein